MTDRQWTGIEAVKADVRNLVTAQEAFRHRHQHYAGSLAILRQEFATLALHGSRAEVRGTDGGYVIVAWDDALKPGPHRCTVHLGTAAEEAGVEAGRIVTD